MCFRCLRDQSSCRGCNQSWDLKKSEHQNSLPKLFVTVFHLSSCFHQQPWLEVLDNQYKIRSHASVPIVVKWSKDGLRYVVHVVHVSMWWKWISVPGCLQAFCGKLTSGRVPQDPQVGTGQEDKFYCQHLPAFDFSFGPFGSHRKVKTWLKIMVFTWLNSHHSRTCPLVFDLGLHLEGVTCRLWNLWSSRHLSVCKHQALDQPCLWGDACARHASTSSNRPQARALNFDFAPRHDCLFFSLIQISSSNLKRTFRCAFVFYATKAAAEDAIKVEISRSQSIRTAFQSFLLLYFIFLLAFTSSLGLRS